MKHQSVVTAFYSILSALEGFDIPSLSRVSTGRSDRSMYSGFNFGSGPEGAFRYHLKTSLRAEQLTSADVVLFGSRFRAIDGVGKPTGRRIAIYFKDSPEPEYVKSDQVFRALLRPNA